MKHYVVILDWATESDCGVYILGVAHTIDEAKEIFNQHIAQERDIAEQHGYTVESDSDTLFEAGQMGYWNYEHSVLYIEEVGK